MITRLPETVFIIIIQLLYFISSLNNQIFLTDVRDIVPQEEYAIPHVHRSSSKTLTSHRSQTTIHDDSLPHHQTLEKYYAASDICQVYNIIILFSVNRTSMGVKQ